MIIDEEWLQDFCKSANMSKEQVIEWLKSPMYNRLEVSEIHGKWIEHEDCAGVFNKCSNCGGSDLIGGLVNEFPYCPWCGCQMDL